MLFSDLNKQQQEAVSILSGPVMVFAGAGSGKTRTLTFRIAQMISSGITPTDILAITFTNKATKEMRDRLFNLVGADASLLTISTFHALCASILRKDIGALKYSNRFSIIDEEDQLKVIKEVLEVEHANKKVYTALYVRNKINYYKTFDIKPEIQYEHQLLQTYEKTMMEANLLDFNDLLIKVKELFSIFPPILERYQAKYKHILVDEFQDTDRIQYDIIKMLAQEHRNLFVVGDDDQSIYSFRGANYGNIRLFKHDFKEYKMVILNQNYRSTQTILKGCNALIGHNSDREKKELFSDIEGQTDDVIIHQALDEADEVHYVIDTIKQLFKEGYTTQDIAILYRSSAVVRQFELGMIESKIDYRIFGGMSYLRRKEIKDMVAYLRLIVFDDDILSFQRVINEPSRGIGLKSVAAILDYRKEHKITLMETLDATRLFLPSKFSVLQEFKSWIERWHQMLETTDLISLYQDILTTTGYIESLEGDEQKEDRIDNLMEFKSILFSIEHTGEVASREEKLIAAFDEAMLSEDKMQTQKQSQTGVTLSTVHSIKGLEFKAVFIVAFETGIFPNIYRSSEVLNMEEERRIAYVACTRAKEKLYLTCASKRLLFGAYHRNPHSPFLLELIGKDQISFAPMDFEKPVVKQQFKMENNTDYHVGDTVMHQSFGEGIVVSLQGDIGKICFTKQGSIKTFDMTHPAISKKS